MLRLKGAMTTEEFLQLVGERLRNSLSLKDFIILSHLYADVAGIKKVRQKPKVKARPLQRKPEPTVNELIVQFEKEHKNGREHPVGQGRNEQENESPASQSEIQRT